MQLFSKVTVLLLGVYLINFASSTKDLDRLKARVKHLETRLNSESKFRDEDFAEITERLDDIDKVLNATIGKEQPIFSAATKASNIDFETVDTLEEDFTRLRTAFTEEKSEAVRFRREIPKIEKNLVSLNEDFESFCKVAVNNTDQLLTNFENVKHVSENNLKTFENDRKVLQSMVEQIQLNTENVKNVSYQITNIETLVTHLYSHIGYLFQGSSCRSLSKFSKLPNGIYGLKQGFKVYCDQTTDDGGWIVFQRRLSGKTDFYRNWNEYKNGFGDLDGEFWLGNEHLSLLTSDGEHELRIEIEDFEGNSAYAKYSKFKIYPEKDNYKLGVSGYSGTAGDSLTYHNDMMFSTPDRDHDVRSGGNCAKLSHGGWWYRNCADVNLNGKYYDHQIIRYDYTLITWYLWNKKIYNLKKVEMKFR